MDPYYVLAFVLMFVKFANGVTTQVFKREDTRLRSFDTEIEVSTQCECKVHCLEVDCTAFSVHKTGNNVRKCRVSNSKTDVFNFEDYSDEGYSIVYSPKYFLTVISLKKMDADKYEKLCHDEGGTSAILYTDADYEQMVADISPYVGKFTYTNFFWAALFTSDKEWGLTNEVLDFTHILNSKQITYKNVYNDPDCYVFDSNFDVGPYYCDIEHYLRLICMRN